MRTKALLCAAALAASAFAASAQVYSQNVVGYINLPLTNGYQLVCNQLDLDGTLTNNTVQTVFGSGLTAGSTVTAYSGGAFTAAATYTGGGKWNANTNLVNSAMRPGQGFWLKSFAAGATNVTIVGQVVQGTNVQALTAGYQIVGAIPPIAGGFQTTLGYRPTGGDSVTLYDPIAKGFTAATTWTGSKWNNGEPQIGIGQAFWLKCQKATNWVQAFTVQ